MLFPFSKLFCLEMPKGLGGDLNWGLAVSSVNLPKASTLGIHQCGIIALLQLRLHLPPLWHRKTKPKDFNMGNKNELPSRVCLPI